MGSEARRSHDDNRGGGAPLNELLGLVDKDRFPYLWYVDPYGTTIFSSKQMEVLIPELEALRQRAKNDDQTRILQGVIELARRCAQTGLTFLVFLGD